MHAWVKLLMLSNITFVFVEIHKVGTIAPNLQGCHEIKWDNIVQILVYTSSQYAQNEYHLKFVTSQVASLLKSLPWELNFYA